MLPLLMSLLGDCLLAEARDASSWLLFGESFRVAWSAWWSGGQHLFWILSEEVWTSRNDDQGLLGYVLVKFRIVFGRTITNSPIAYLPVGWGGEIAVCRGADGGGAIRSITIGSIFDITEIFHLFSQDCFSQVYGLFYEFSLYWVWVWWVAGACLFAATCQ